MPPPPGSRSHTAMVHLLSKALAPTTRSNVDGLTVTVLVSLIAEYVPFVGMVTTCEGATRGWGYLHPSAICRYADGDDDDVDPTDFTRPISVSYLVPQRGAHSVVRFNTTLQKSVRYAGGKYSATKPARCKLTELGFDSPTAICAAPNPVGGIPLYFCSDYTSIIQLSVSGARLISGSHYGWADGRGVDAEYTHISGLSCTSDGKQLYVTDAEVHKLRTVNVETGDTVTVAGDGINRTKAGVGLAASFNEPRQMVWDRARSAAPDSTLYIASMDSIRRYETKSKRCSTVKWVWAGVDESLPRPPSAITIQRLSLNGIECVPDTGMLIVSCAATHSIYAADPVSGVAEMIAGSGRTGFGDGLALDEGCFEQPGGLILCDNNEHAAYVCDSGGDRLVHLTLPPFLFVRTS